MAYVRCAHNLNVRILHRLTCVLKCRCIRRLEELVAQLAGVCKVIGNSELENKFTQASTMMKRDIVFAASLYL